MKKYGPMWQSAYLPADQWQVADQSFMDDLKGQLPMRDDEMVKLYEALERDTDD